MAASPKNLVIVESPAKSETIKKYLGTDFEVKASYGHVADLSKKKMGIDIENDFTPDYVISPDKKKVVNELKRLAKWAETVWIATDEDREGEAIGWHVAHELWLDIKTTPRIVFHEITKPAITHAVKNPRTIDMNLVDAQQARRVLDRLVWFELSPVLWRKVKGWLSAGRVQSVAVRLIVAREREIQEFDAASSLKIVGDFLWQKGEFQAEVTKKLSTVALAQKFLEEANESTFTVKSLEVKPGKKSPTAPFTTSTLQQEASRKLWYSVSQTMRVAQKLYEWWLITYMRTDSVNLSQTASDAATKEIVSAYGKEYSQPTNYTSKTTGAQEAHECIRPTDFAKHTAWADAQAKKLYELIWKRAIASQMSPAQLEKTKAVIDVSGSKTDMVAKGEMIKFDGFLKVYLEWRDDEHEETKGMLPLLVEWEMLEMKHIIATEQFDRHPPRYTEASLVKKLESEWIGRPSTYAPTIATVQKRWYVDLDDREWVLKKYQVLTLKNWSISETTEEKRYGTEKKKLFPTDIGMVVTDFLLKYFPDIMDYHFTATVEEQFDHIAHGQEKRVEMIRSFYGPFHAVVEKTIDTAERESGEREIGIDPKSWKKIITRLGRYGPLVQIGDADDEEKKFASIPHGLSMEDLTLEQALECFALPRKLGEYEGYELSANIGRFGPYIKWNSTFASLKISEEFPDDDPYKVTKERAIVLVQEKLQKDKEKIIHEREHNGEVRKVENGRRWPFLRVGKKNVKLPKERKDKEKAKELTLEECVKIASAS